MRFSKIAIFKCSALFTCFNNIGAISAVKANENGDSKGKAPNILEFVPIIFELCTAMYLKSEADFLPVNLITVLNLS